MKSSDFQKVIRKLKKEFDLVDDSTDHCSYEVWKNGKLIIPKVKNSNSPKDYQDDFIAHNLHISRSQLNLYKSCTFTNLQLIQKIKDKHHWPDDI